VKIWIEESRPGELASGTEAAQRALEALAKEEGCTCGCDPLEKAQRRSTAAPEQPADRLPRAHIDPNVERILAKGRKERDRIHALMLRRIEDVLSEVV